VTSDHLDCESLLPGGVAETQIVTDEWPPARLLIAPNQRGAEMEFVSSANRKSLQLNTSQFAKRIGRLDLAAGTQECLQPIPGSIVSPRANCPLLSQSLEDAPDLNTRRPPDNNRVLARESPSRAGALPGYSDVNDRACVPEGRHNLFGPLQSPAGLLSLSSGSFSFGHRYSRTASNSIAAWEVHVPGCHQRKLFRIPVFTMQRDNFGNRQVSVTDDKLLAGSHAMQERAKLILQLRNIRGTHMAIVAISAIEPVWDSEA